MDVGTAIVNWGLPILFFGAIAGVIIALVWSSWRSARTAEWARIVEETCPECKSRSVRCEMFDYPDGVRKWFRCPHGHEWKSDADRVGGGDRG